MKSFLSGRSQSSAGSLQAPAGTGTSSGFVAKSVGGAHKEHAQGGAGPTVECVKQGDKVTSLIVTCACGERIEIECIYPAGG